MENLEEWRVTELKSEKVTISGGEAIYYGQCMNEIGGSDPGESSLWDVLIWEAKVILTI